MCIYIYIYTGVWGDWNIKCKRRSWKIRWKKGVNMKKPTRATLGLDNLADDLHCTVLAPELQKFSECVSFGVSWLTS